MFGIAATRSGRFERRTARRLSTWTRDYLREVALVDLGCAVLGVFVAAQIRFGNDVTSTYAGPEPGPARALGRRLVAGRRVRRPVYRDRF